MVGSFAARLIVALCNHSLRWQSAGITAQQLSTAASANGSLCRVGFGSNSWGFAVPALTGSYVRAKDGSVWRRNVAASL